MYAKSVCMSCIFIFFIGHKGYIHAHEFAETAHSMGIQINEDELKRTIHEVDTDGNGTIDFNEFCVVMKRLTAKRLTWDDIVRPCFDVFDRVSKHPISISTQNTITVGQWCSNRR
jgi:Ca2+-binding EF-hand superfamily protein